MQSTRSERYRTNVYRDYWWANFFVLLTPRVFNCELSYEFQQIVSQLHTHTFLLWCSLFSLLTELCCYERFSEKWANESLTMGNRLFARLNNNEFSCACASVWAQRVFAIYAVIEYIWSICIHHSPRIEIIHLIPISIRWHNQYTCTLAHNT